MNKHLTRLNTWGEIRSRGDLAIQFQLNPTSVYLFVLEGFGDVNLERGCAVVIGLGGQWFQRDVFKLLHKMMGK